MSGINPKYNPFVVNCAMAVSCAGIAIASLEIIRKHPTLNDRVMYVAAGLAAGLWAYELAAKK